MKKPKGLYGKTTEGAVNGINPVKPNQVIKTCAVCGDEAMGWCESFSMKLPTCPRPDHATILNAICYVWDLIVSENKKRRKSRRVRR